MKEICNFYLGVSNKELDDKPRWSRGIFVRCSWVPSREAVVCSYIPTESIPCFRSSKYLQTLLVVQRINIILRKNKSQAGITCGASISTNTWSTPYIDKPRIHTYIYKYYIYFTGERERDRERTCEIPGIRGAELRTERGG